MRFGYVSVQTSFQDPRLAPGVGVSLTRRGATRCGARLGLQRVVTIGFAKLS